MAVANTKSAAITNADATPRVPNSSYFEKGMLRESVGAVATVAGDDDGSVYRMVRVPSGARVSQILIAHGTVTGGTDFDIGIYKTAADGGTVVDADLFCSAIDLSTARAQLTDLTHESAANVIADIGKRLWELAGLSEDPMIDYDICFTGNTVGSGAVPVVMLARYVI